jgi:ATP-independent RNA helicase DbpA
MTPIQNACLPIALAGKDLIAQAKTGSGKTAAFSLTLLSNLDPSRYAIQALVLCPTRELADQVATEIRRLARAHENIKVLTLCGGGSLHRQTHSLSHSAHIVVGTPGRILDHLSRGNLSLDHLNTLVLDEADRMLDMGFFDSIQKVVELCPSHRQTLLFSATYPEGIVRLSKKFMRAPEQVKVESIHLETTLEQRCYEVRPADKFETVAKLLNHYKPVSTLAFCNTKQQCKLLSDYLHAKGFSVLTLHGDLEQRDRDQVLVLFSNRSCSVLVATDVAARGLDINQIEAVINVDISPDPEVHVHRIGRTGRAGETGLALSLVSLAEMPAIVKIEQYQQQTLAWFPIESLKPKAGDILQPPMVTIQILGGRKEKIRPGDVLGALTAGSGYGRDEIGKINVTDFITYVAVKREIGREVVRKMNAGMLKGKPVKSRLI